MNEQLPSEKFSISNVLRVSARVRPELNELTPLERLELCGVWALCECIDSGCSDESIAVMFDTMKERMLSQAAIFRAGRRSLSN